MTSDDLKVVERALQRAQAVGTQEVMERLWLLANVLLNRHYNISGVDSGATMDRGVAPPRPSVATSELVIAVVGAGGSAKRLLPSDGIVRRLEDRELDRLGYQRQLERLARNCGLDPDAFETRLAALCRSAIGEEDVRREIQRSYNFRHPTVLAYELVAHLLKARFIDAVVTLNFDELLDQSIEDELRPHEYHLIVTERDCRGVEFNAASPDFKPLCIKLHGTASDPETLRFVQSAYSSERGEFSSSILKLLDVSRCTVLSIGSSLNSIELHEFLATPTSLEIFNLSLEPLAPKSASGLDAARSKDRTAVHEVQCRTAAGGGADADVLLCALSYLLDEIRAFDPSSPLVTRSIARHLAAANLLDFEVSKFDARAREYGEYLQARAILELAFAAVKGRGLVSVHSLALDRGATYYDLARAVFQRAGRPECGRSWKDICAIAGLVPEDLTGETFRTHPDVGRKPGPPDLESPVNNPPVLEKLAERVLVYIQGSCKSTLSEAERAGLLLEALRSMCDGTEVELRPWDDLVCSKIFAQPKRLPTLTSMHAATRDLLRQEGLERLDVIAETGEWLVGQWALEYLAKRESRPRIRLLVAFKQVVGESTRPDPQSLVGLYGGNLECRWTQWWRHNRHMTITYRCGRPSGALYFSRRLRTPFITPVLLRDPADLQIMVKGFDKLWREGRHVWPEHDGQPQGEPEDCIPSLPASELDQDMGWTTPAAWGGCGQQPLGVPWYEVPRRKPPAEQG